MMKARNISLLLTAALLPALGCIKLQSEPNATFDRQISMEGVEELILETRNGRVEVESSDSEVVQVYVRFEMPERYNLDEILTVRQEGTRLIIEEDWPRRKFFLGDDTEATYMMKVPSRTSLKIESVNGRLTSNGVSGAQKLESVNGRIEVSTPSSELDAGTVNGGIQVTFTESFSGARLGTVNGSVKVRVPEGTEMVADVSQVNGSFNSEIPLQMHTSGVDMPVLDVSTVNGSIRVLRYE